LALASLSSCLGKADSLSRESWEESRDECEFRYHIAGVGDEAGV
jgi:hypothetical protein